MSTARKILWNTASQIIGKAMIAVLGIVVVKLVTNYLGRAGYGEYTAAFEFLAFFSIVADLGLYTIGVREMAKDEKKIPMIIGNVLTIRTVVAILMIGGCAVSAYFIPKYANTRIPFAVMIAGAATIFNLLTATISSVLQVYLKMEYNSLASVIGKIINVGYMAIVIYYLYPINTAAFSANPACLAKDLANCPMLQTQTMGFYHLIFAGFLGNLAMLLVTFYYSRKLTQIKYRIDMEFWKDVIVKALPYGIALVLNTIYFRIGSVLLSLIRPTTDDVGVYGVPMRMLEAVGVVPLYFMNAVLPVLTRSLQRKDGSHQKIIQYAFDFLVMGSLPIVAGTIALAYPIIYLISSPEFLSNISQGFYGSDIALQILICALFFSFLNSLFGFILVADNKQTKLLIRNTIGACLTFLLDSTFIPHFGVRAAAFDNVITECYVAVASYLIAKHYIKFSIKLGTSLKALLAAVVMAVVIRYLSAPTYNLFHLQNKNIIILIPVGCVVYIGILILTKAITKDMIAMVRRPKAVTPEIKTVEGEM